MKDPRIALRTTADHKAITSGLLFHGDHIFGIQKISISYDRNGYGIFDLGDNVPIGFAGIILLSCPAMYGNGCHTGIFRNLCHFHGIDMGIVKTFADLDCDRLLNGFYRFSHDLPCQFGIFHQCGAVAVINDFWHRTAHIDI